MIRHRPSPNQGERRAGARPDILVLHYTGMASAGAALDRLCDPAAEVSAHYVVEETGTTWSLVPEAARAWHAGVSCWGAVRDVNSRSIGVEIVNPGDAPFPEPQMAATEILIAEIMARWSIPPERVVGHACIAPGRKGDPGRRFDWRRLARGGLAVWLDPPICDRTPADAHRFRAAARRFGYGLADEEGWGRETNAVWDAFQMRFRPGEGAPPSVGGVAHLEALAARWPVVDRGAASL